MGSPPPKFLSRSTEYTGDRQNIHLDLFIDQHRKLLDIHYLGCDNPNPNLTLTQVLNLTLTQYPNPDPNQGSKNLGFLKTQPGGFWVVLTLTSVQSTSVVYILKGRCDPPKLMPQCILMC